MGVLPQVRSGRVVPGKRPGSSTLTTVAELDAALRQGLNVMTLARPLHRGLHDMLRNWARERAAGTTQPSGADNCMT